MKLPKISEELKPKLDHLELTNRPGWDPYKNYILHYGLKAVTEAYHFNKMRDMVIKGADEKELIEKLGIIICPVDGPFWYKGDFLFDVKSIEPYIYVPARVFENLEHGIIPGKKVVQMFDYDDGNSGAGLFSWWHSKRRERLNQLRQGRDSLVDKTLHRDGLWYSRKLWEACTWSFVKYANIGEKPDVEPIPEAFMALELTKYYSGIINKLTD